MTSSPHGPYGLGYTRATMAKWPVGMQDGNMEQILNFRRSSDFELLATREHEVGIASNRRSACYGEFVSKPCTHRPSHNGSGTYTKHIK